MLFLLRKNKRKKRFYNLLFLLFSFVWYPLLVFEGIHVLKKNQEDNKKYRIKAAHTSLFLPEYCLLKSKLKEYKKHIVFFKEYKEDLLRRLNVLQNTYPMRWFLKAASQPFSHISVLPSFVFEGIHSCIPCKGSIPST